MANVNFYDIARKAIEVEANKLEIFIDELERDLDKKSDMIEEYKCAKYRHSGIENISVKFFFSNKSGYKFEEQYYQIPDVWRIVKNDKSFIEAVDNVSDDEKRVVALYRGILAYADYLIAKKEALLATATDWEKVELEEYLAGHKFAQKCIIDAWEG